MRNKPIKNAAIRLMGALRIHTAERTPYAALGKLIESLRPYDAGIELIRRLWREDFVTFEGEYFRTHNATIYDRPERPLLALLRKPRRKLLPECRGREGASGVREAEQSLRPEPRKLFRQIVKTNQAIVEKDIAARKIATTGTRVFAFSVPTLSKKTPSLAIA